MTDQHVVITDARNEVYRTYVYGRPDGYEHLIIEDPVFVFESNGAHVIVDADGVAHIPVPGFLSVEIKFKS